MLHEYLFLIKPKPQFIETLVAAGLNPEGFEDDDVWSHTRADRSAWERSDLEEAVRQAFVFWIRKDLMTEEEVKILDLEGIITSDMFERYWTMERLPSAFQVSVVISDAGREDDFPVTSPMLLAHHQSERKRRTAQDKTSDG